MLKTTTLGYFEMIKKYNNFYFVGQTVNSNAYKIYPMGTAFGAIGAVVATSKRNNDFFLFEINYKLGNPILISKEN